MYSGLLFEVGHESTTSFYFSAYANSCRQAHPSNSCKRWTKCKELTMVRVLDFSMLDCASLLVFRAAFLSAKLLRRKRQMCSKVAQDGQFEPDHWTFGASAMKFTASVLFFSQSYLRLFTLLILYSTHLNYYFVIIFYPYSSYFRLVEAF